MPNMGFPIRAHKKSGHMKNTEYAMTLFTLMPLVCPSGHVQTIEKCICTILNVYTHVVQIALSFALVNFT